jgi:hypothetical protein
MDISGFVRILETELQANKGLALENHLYGCLSLWEQWAEGELTLENGKGVWDGESFDISADNSWSQMGPAFGFEETSPPYTGSEAYRAAWHLVFTSDEWKTLERVDAVEETLFGHLGALGAVWMAAALPTGELPPGFCPEVTETNEKEKPIKGFKRTGLAAYKKTRRTHGRRSLTPVNSHHTLKMTRRQKQTLSSPYL